MRSTVIEASRPSKAGSIPRRNLYFCVSERSLMTFSQRSWPSCIAFGCSWRNLIAPSPLYYLSVMMCTWPVLTSRNGDRLHSRAPNPTSQSVIGHEFVNGALDVLHRTCPGELRPFVQFIVPAVMNDDIVRVGYQLGHDCASTIFAKHGFRNSHSP